MQNEPENKPPRRRPLIIAFLLAGLGLVLLNGAADALALHHRGLSGSVMIIGGAAFLLLAVLWGTKRV
ncbi:MAG: hypothetical protein EPO07_15855 [Verrucomicrobia bacterium]|nr:MAG: hypothetical protein EPO07_15855 [Verrucomicrobiota bacterium]